MSHPHRIQELDQVLAACAEQLSHILAIHRAVSRANTTHQLGLELPREQVYLDAISRLASLHRELRAAGKESSRE